MSGRIGCAAPRVHRPSDATTCMYCVVYSCLPITCVYVCISSIVRARSISTDRILYRTWTLQVPGQGGDRGGGPVRRDGGQEAAGGGVDGGAGREPEALSSAHVSRRGCIKTDIPSILK